MTKIRQAGSPLRKSRTGALEESQCDTCADLKDFIMRENARSVEAIRSSNERRLAAVEEALSFSMDTLSNVAARQQSYGRDILQLRQENAEIMSRLRCLEMQEDRLQQEKRLACLLFSGPAVECQNQYYDAAWLIHSLIRRYMHYDMDQSQIKTAFRLRSRKIMVEFSSAAPGSDRDVLFRSKSKLKGSGLFISESLTPRRQAMHLDLLRLKKERVICSVFTCSGDLLVCKSRDSAPIRVADPETVRQLCEPQVTGHSGQGRAQVGTDGIPQDQVQIDLSHTKYVSGQRVGVIFFQVVLQGVL